ncbi:MAG TPA: hypothetical protein VJT69_09255 [Pyrinomonadaceae bacterium]|nr:hypothetical protein [Pyrinomonadaceae bacterium]
MLAHTIFADVIWPALFLESRLRSTWIILAGLVIEYFVVWRVTSLGAWRSILADVAINIASTVLGIVLIPLAGIAWEFFPGIFLYKIFNLGTFNPATWTVTFCMAVVINAALEMTVLRIWFQQHFGKDLFGWLCLANALSVGLAMASFLIYPARQS